MKNKITLKVFANLFFLIIGINLSFAQVVTSSADDGSAGTLRSQIAAASSGATITFNVGVTNVSLTMGQIIIDKSLTLTGNGLSNTTIDANNVTRIFDVTVGNFTINDLTLTNGTADNGGAIQLNGANLTLNNVIISNSTANGMLGSGGAILVGSNASLTASLSTFNGNVANRAGGAIEVTAGTTTLLNGVTITNNNAGVSPATPAPGNGGGLHVTGNATVTLTDGIVSNNISASEGGGLWNGSGTMNIIGTTITFNTASGPTADNGGGGIYNLNLGTLNIMNATITNNIANGTAGSGGGILSDVGSTLSVTNTMISGNRSNRAGGGIEAVAGTTTTLTNVSLINNNTGVSPAIAAPGNGGGFHITGNGTATINGGTVNGNLSANQGAGLWNGSGTMTVNGTTINGNTVSGNAATSGGGGLYNQVGTLNLINSSVSNNTATGMLAIGGGILNNGAIILIDNSTLSSNSSNLNGGGIYTTNGATTIQNNSTLDLNIALGATAPTDGGGGIYISAGTVTVTNSSLTNNKAITGGASGGAIFNFAGTLNAISTTISQNISNRAGGGIEAAAGTTNTLSLVNLNSNVTGVLASGATASSPGNGGGMHVTGNATTTITGGTVNSNLAAAEGGGLWNGTGIMTVDATAINANSASGVALDNGGGGIYQNNTGTLILQNNATISNNNANGTLGSGGGILCDVGANLTVTNSTISGNIANRAGGGIEAQNMSNITLTNVNLNNNNVGISPAVAAPGNGGGLHVTGNAIVNITGGTVNSNIAAAEGGGLWNGTGTMTINGTTINSNTASGVSADNGGGGIYNLNAGTLSISNAIISNNIANGTAGSGGGILNDVGSQLSITNTAITGNTAIRAGGGIEDNSGTSTLVLTNVNLNNNSVSGPPGNGGGMHITGGGSVTISGGTVNGNLATLEGGGLWNGSGTMTLNGTTINGNTSTGSASDDGGAGIFNNAGTLNLDTVSVTNNNATGTAGSGGGLLSLLGAVTIINSTLDSNSANRAGGAIEAVNGTLTITNSSLTNNDVDGTAGTPNPGNGGALHISGVVTTAITGGEVSGNDARREGGGLWNQTGSTMTINNLKVDNNSASGAGATFGGGGIFVNGGTLVVNSSTISNNVSDGVAGNGGGIHVKTGSATITTSTVSGNSSATKGGGIYSNSGLNINASTIANNNAAIDGGGIANESTSFPTLKNTIVATNSASTNVDVSSTTGAFISNGYNLLGQATATTFVASTGDLVGTTGSPINPLFDGLANNGGLTFTHALLSGSPAYNAGDVADTFADQIGQAIFGGRRDIGAFEAQSTLASTNFETNSSAIYPNPATNGYVIIQLKENQSNSNGSIIEVGSGKVVKQFNMNQTENKITLDGLSSGIYVVRLTSDNFTENHKLIVR